MDGYAREKFYRNDRVCNLAADSPLWRRISEHHNRLLELTQWVIGKGEIKFWTENWVGQVLRGLLPCDANLTVAQGLYCISELWGEIPHHLHNAIRAFRVDNAKEDRLIFKLTTSGAFSTKEFMNYSRGPIQKRGWTPYIGHSSLPPNISTFLWKVLRHAIPMDCRVRTRGVVLVSSSGCCKAHQEESLTHLFIHSEVAQEIWKCFGRMLRLPYRFNSIVQAVASWMKMPTHPSQFDICRMATAAHILHEIWVDRCRATYDDKPMNARQVCLQIIRKVHLISVVHSPQRPATKLQYHHMEIMGISRKHIRFKRGGWHRWVPPATGEYKLNIDGSTRGNFMTGGGVIRDSCGGFIAGFSTAYGNGTNMIAEFRALLEGLVLCHSLHISRISIESDAAVVVHAIKQGKIDNWRLQYIVQDCLQEFRGGYQIEHIFREKNMVTDRLAAWAHDHQQQLEVYRIQDCPQMVRSAYVADNLRIWNYSR